MLKSGFKVSEKHGVLPNLRHMLKGFGLLFCSMAIAVPSIAQTSLVTINNNTVTIEAEDYHRFVDTTGGNTGGAYRQDDVDIESSSTASGFNVGWTDTGEILTWDVDINTAGLYDIELNIASNSSDQVVDIRIDGNSIGTLDLAAATGGWQTWDARNDAFTLPSGAHELSILFLNSGFNLDNLKITLLTEEEPEFVNISTSNETVVEAEDYHAYDDTTQGNTGGAYRQDDVDIQVDNQGGFNVGWIESGESLDWDVQLVSGGAFNVTAQLASASNDVGIDVQIDGQSVAQITAPTTEGWQNWDNASTAINIPEGNHTLSFVANTSGFNFNRWSLTPTDPTGPTDPVDFGGQVTIFDSSMSDSFIQSQIDQIFSIQQLNHALYAWDIESTERSAILFQPGAYNVDIPVGFYTQVLGLGASPEDVVINGRLSSEPYLSIIHPEWGNNATQNFWRGVENFSTTGSTVEWAVSQSTYFRRMNVNGDLNLYVVDNSRPSWNVKSWGSGGWISDSAVSGTIDAGLQQQWYTRNSEWGGTWSGESNNFMAFTGINNSNIAIDLNIVSNIATTPIIAEKPSLVFNGNGYEVLVPDLKTNSSGVSWSGGTPAGRTIPISDFFVAKPSDSVSTINTALSQGKHLLLTPGIYNLNDTIRVTQADTVVLGLAFPTLHSQNGNAALSVADVDGVRVANVTVTAGTTLTPVLIEVGAAGSSANHGANPTVMSDIYVAIGGSVEGQAGTAMEVNSNNVILDHAWLWRADHGVGVGWDFNKGRNGLVVNGDNVTAYGLFVEHFQEYQVLWAGNNGRTYFYQSEIPYDPPYQAAWSSATGVNGWASYKVASGVTSHEAWGLGIYTAFSTAGITLTRGIEAPQTSGVKFHNMVNAKFNSTLGGQITFVINDQADPTGVVMGDNSAGKPRVADYP